MTYKFPKFWGLFNRSKAAIQNPELSEDEFKEIILEDILPDEHDQEFLQTSREDMVKKDMKDWEYEDWVKFTYGENHDECWREFEKELEIQSRKNKRRMAIRSAILSCLELIIILDQWLKF